MSPPMAPGDVVTVIFPAAVVIPANVPNAPSTVPISRAFALLKAIELLPVSAAAKVPISLSEERFTSPAAVRAI